MMTPQGLKRRYLPGDYEAGSDSKADETPHNPHDRSLTPIPLPRWGQNRLRGVGRSGAWRGNNESPPSASHL